MAEQYANDAQTTLANAAGSGDATITVSSTTGFPGSGNFRIRIDNELLLVAAVSGATWTVTRAAEPIGGLQTAAAHTQGATVTHVLTAASVQNVVQGSATLSSLYINTNSTTALKVEQAGVVPNVLVVDTTNGRVGVGAAPSYVFHVTDGGYQFAISATSGFFSNMTTVPSNVFGTPWANFAPNGNSDILCCWDTRTGNNALLSVRNTGQLFCWQTAAVHISLNSSGTHNGQIQNDAADLWSLAWASNVSVLGTKAMQWGQSGGNTVLGFYGATAVSQPATTAGHGATAGAAYGANEQKMLQDVFNALEALGLMA
jgi:hypothetical protein